jgi:hypothetical protein
VRVKRVSPFEKEKNKEALLLRALAKKLIVVVSSPLK